MVFNPRFSIFFNFYLLNNLDELNILNKLHRSDLSTPSLPVKMESLKNKPDSLDSLTDSVVVSTERNTENLKYDLVNCCKDQSFETALQRATKYAALIGKFQDRVNVYLNSLPTSHNQPDSNNTDAVNSTSKYLFLKKSRLHHDYY
ncbi:unnamed protein product [Trichobilharzia regenti]|nr:unnamed protein product [Trichobilharzia regenti]